MATKFIYAALILCAVALAQAANEKYAVFTTYQDSSCSASVVVTTFATTDCLFYDLTYKKYECRSNAVVLLDCGTDQFCSQSSCSTASTQDFSSCTSNTRASCTNDDFTGTNGKDAPVKYTYAQKDCNEDNLLFVEAFTTANSTTRNWAECVNDVFYSTTCVGGCNRTAQSSECTYDRSSDISLIHECGWPSSAAAITLSLFVIATVVFSLLA